MTQIILQSDEFIIKMTGDVGKVIIGQESMGLRIINPHVKNTGDSSKFNFIKGVLTACVTTRNENIGTD